ncbi:DnaB-like helicase C-terminal domain-containing protein [Microvirga arabica]|uniref:DnaB-like helicase C-terminal domain-containing protein n=1 Tax=Microvirga arabica TaxID=1128671 RepID=UPI001939D50B|nr:DnaB-like helicase C-terminal domain-containing protein [Microvirga arabica]MBM1169914.1 AAA family ATPase [Microvirga arabica]
MMEQSSTAGTATGAEALPKLSAAAMSYAETVRKISRTTLERLGVGSGTVFFPDLHRESEALLFPYRAAGEVLNWKAAAFPVKAFTSKKGGKLQFWNIERAIGSGTVFITEGEMDAASLVEAGIPVEQVISVPNGARSRTSDASAELRGYGYVEEALRNGLNRTKRFIFCGDNDDPGRALRADLVRLFGAARFHYVDWPEGCKDANEVLRTYGPSALHDLVTQGARPWPVEGLYRLEDLPEPPPLTLWHPGFSEWESKVHLAPRTLSVVTGHPGHGKTTLFMQIWYQICKQYGLAAAIASFETRAKPHHRRTLRQLHAGKFESAMTEKEIRAADAWINDRFFWVLHPEQRPSLEWFLEMAEVAVIRHGARIIQVDPWNRLEAARGPGESETEHIGRSLRTLHAFAHDLNCHVQVLAHPSKMDATRKGKAPELEDISGSKNWDNMVDQGFVVHRPKFVDENGRNTEAEFYQRKSRFEELGYPCKLKMSFDLKTGRYHSADYPAHAGCNKMPVEK